MAEAYHEELLALNRELGDRHGEAGCLCHLGRIAQARGDFVLTGVIPKVIDGDTVEVDFTNWFEDASSEIRIDEIKRILADPVNDVCVCRLNDDSDPIETLWSWSANLDSREAYLADGRSDLKSGRWISYAQQTTKFRLSR